MAVLVEKQVIFSGIWRPRYGHMDDSFLRGVSREFLEKPGARASWRLTSEGLTVLVTQSESGRQGRTDQIPLIAIRDVAVNRYSPVCLMTFYVDQANRFSALVCQCEEEKDAVELASVFRTFQSSKVREEVSFLKQPYSLNGQVTVPTLEDGPKANGHAGSTTLVSAKREIVVELEKKHLPREKDEVKGRPCCSVGVQAALSDCDSDVESSASTMTLQSLREELHSLSQEVRDIRDLLQRTGGISTEEYFRRNPGPGSDKYVAVLPRGHVLPSPAEPHKGQISEKKVNFADTVRSTPQAVVMVEGGQDQDHDHDFDIRSIGMQTEVGTGGGSRYAKRPRNFSPHDRAKIPATYRHPRSSSSTSSSGPFSPAVPLSPYSPSVFSNGGTDFSFNVTKRPLPHSQHELRFRSASLPRGAGLPSKAVVRPIEMVYHTHASSVRHKKTKEMMKPASSVVNISHGGVISGSFKKSRPGGNQGQL